MIWCSGFSHRKPVAFFSVLSCQERRDAAVKWFGDATLCPCWSTDEFQLPGLGGAKRSAGAWTGMGLGNGGPPRSTNRIENHSQSKTSRRAHDAPCNLLLGVEENIGPLAVPPSQAAPQGTAAGSWSQGGQKAMAKLQTRVPRTVIAPRGWQGDSSSQDGGPPLRAPRRRTSNTRTTGPQSSSSLSHSCNGGGGEEEKRTLCADSPENDRFGLRHSFLWCHFVNRGNRTGLGPRWSPSSPGGAGLSGMCAPLKKGSGSRRCLTESPSSLFYPGQPLPEEAPCRWAWSSLSL